MLTRKCALLCKTQNRGIISNSHNRQDATSPTWKKEKWPRKLISNDHPPTHTHTLPLKTNASAKTYTAAEQCDMPSRVESLPTHDPSSALSGGLETHPRETDLHSQYGGIQSHDGFLYCIGRHHQNSDIPQVAEP